ncbi:MAG: succinate dehydrogenase, hydrophobic membrane anchor protein [Wenzhouxiangella sp.]|jgi:succinate dehydrogenase / fumarate reductase membrane anchor subunit|nr:succinate dehydrogenase, hydrophobic membrane anchor protein [Wenzhouxiangella sp.]
MNLRNPLANAHNHGAAGDGVGHWWAQRFSAILLVFLTTWVVYALVSLIGASHAAAADWLARPFNAAMGVLFVVTSIYHGKLGLQVIIEDYIHNRATEVVLQLAVKIASIIGALLAVFAILKLAFGA